VSRLQRFLGLAALVATAYTLSAATITTGEPTAHENGRSELPIYFQSGPGQLVSGLQFEITFDPALLNIEDVAAGPIAISADKMVSFNSLKRGRCRVIIAGFNQNVLEGGILATLRLHHDGPGIGIVLDNPVMSDPKGKAVPGTAKGIQSLVPGTVTNAEVVSQAEVPAPVPERRPACACASQPAANHYGDGLLLLSLGGWFLLESRRSRQCSK